MPRIVPAMIAYKTLSELNSEYFVSHIKSKPERSRPRDLHMTHVIDWTKDECHCPS